MCTRVTRSNLFWVINLNKWMSVQRFGILSKVFTRCISFFLNWLTLSAHDLKLAPQRIEAIETFYHSFYSILWEFYNYNWYFFAFIIAKRNEKTDRYNTNGWSIFSLSIPLHIFICIFCCIPMCQVLYAASLADILRVHIN